MNTLVLKCKESVDNSSLRGMNEFRFVLKAQGDGSGVIFMGNLKSEGNKSNVLPEWEILSGSAYFTNNNGTQNFGKTRSAETLYVKADTDSVVRIKNFDICCDCLGVSTDSIKQFSMYQVSAANAPCPVLDSSELKGKDIASIFADKADVVFTTKDVATIDGIKEIYTGSYNRTIEWTGRMSDIPSSIELFHPVMINVTNDNSNISWSFDDIIAKTNLKKVVLDGQACSGGDLYTLLASKSELFLSATRTNINHDVPNITCSYVSGTSIIPSVTIKYLKLFRTGSLTKESIMSFMNLIKDGIDANKITIDVGYGELSFKCANGVAADSDVVALKNTLAAAPYNVNMFIE